MGMVLLGVVSYLLTATVVRPSLIFLALSSEAKSYLSCSLLCLISSITSLQCFTGTYLISPTNSISSFFSLPTPYMAVIPPYMAVILR